MSNDALSWAWRLKLTSTEKLVLASLADRCDRYGRCWGGIQDMMDRTALAQRTIQITCRSLATLGYLEITKRLNPNGTNRTNLYRVLFTERWDAAPAPATVQPDEDEDGAYGGGGALDDIGEGAANDIGAVKCGGEGASDGQNYPAPHAPLNNHQERRTIKEEPKQVPRVPARGGVTGKYSDPDFEAFWRDYPNKNAKADALKAWTIAIRITDPAEIIAGVRAYPFRVDPQYQPLPATWLRQERWLPVEHTRPVCTAAAAEVPFKNPGIELFAERHPGKTYDQVRDEIDRLARGEAVEGYEDDPPDPDEITEDMPALGAPAYDDDEPSPRRSGSNGFRPLGGLFGGG